MATANTPYDANEPLAWAERLDKAFVAGSRRSDFVSEVIEETPGQQDEEIAAVGRSFASTGTRPKTSGWSGRPSALSIIKEGVCGYHRRYGHEAKRCASGCVFHGQGETPKGSGSARRQ